MISEFRMMLNKLDEMAKPQDWIWDETCKYCDTTMNICNHPRQPDMFARCEQIMCPILHPEIIEN